MMPARMRESAGCVIFLGVTLGFTSTVLILVMGLPTYLAWMTGLSSLAIVAAAAIALRKYHHQPDLAPDFLSALSPLRYADADGFCFHVFPAVQDGRLLMRIHFQNRNDRPCHTRLRFTPNRFFRKGLAEFGIEMLCEAGAYGVAEVPWPIAKKLAGQKIVFTVHSEVTHPNGRGRPLRFRLGADVRSGRTYIHLRIPTDFDENRAPLPPTTRVEWILEPGLAFGFPVHPSHPSHPGQPP